MPNLSNYKLTFDDEFNTLSISANGAGAKWAATRPLSVIAPGVENGFGDSAFVDATTGVQPFSLQNGALDITAQRVTGDLAGVVSPRTWVSGLISSVGTFSQTYGYFEIRAQLPAGAGAWPAFWLLPANQTWPPELDVMEVYGADTHSVSSTVHTMETGSYSNTQVWSTQSDWSSGYHTYGALWTPTTITFYYDNVATGVVNTPADMHQAMYLLANLGISAGVPGTTDDPKHMQIDYIRAFSDDANAVAATLDTISSPDSANASDLHGATAANIATPAPDTLTIHVSGDSWNGAPKFIVSVDGNQIGGTYSVTALHPQGQWQDVVVTGTFGDGPHRVTINYINDGNSGAYYDPATNIVYNDRNIFVGSINLNGTQYGLSAVTSNTAASGWDRLDTAAAVMAANGAVTFATNAATVQPPTTVTPPTTTPPTTTPPATTTPPTTTPPTTTGGDSLTILISGDSWNGPPQFTVTLDGQQIGSVYSVTALHSLGQRQTVTINGDFGVGPHTVAINYINDGNSNPYYDPATNMVYNDRNIFVHSVSIDGSNLGVVTSNTASSNWDFLDPNSAVMAGNGTVTYSFAAQVQDRTIIGDQATFGPAFSAPLLNQTLTGDSGNDHIYGDAQHLLGDSTLGAYSGGNDTLHGGAGNDFLYGDAGDMGEAVIGGNDTLYGEDGNDIIYGDAELIHGPLSKGGDDQLYGGAGNDSLYGDGNLTSGATGGNDLLDGGAGNDDLWGNAGDDTFVFAPGSGADVIHDFNQGNAAIGSATPEHDRIDLRSYGISNLSQLTIANDANGNAMITLPGQASISLLGMHASDLKSDDFLFAAAPTPPAQGSLVLHISGDSWNGPPKFTVSVDGQQVGGVLDVTALHSNGEWQDISIDGTFGSGGHDIAISYINDANSGAYYDAAANVVRNDRNIFVDYIKIGGHTYETATTNTASIGWDFLDPNAAVMAANGIATYHVNLA